MHTEADSLQERPRYPAIRSGITGLGLMGLVGAIEGAVTGMMLTAFMDTPLGLPMGASIGAHIALYVGAPAGLICFIIAGAICRDMPDFREAMKSVRDAAVRGSVIGVTLGGVMGMAAQWMLHKPHHLEHGYTLGVIAGFILGTFIGGITVATREAYGLADTPATERRAPRELSAHKPSITITLHDPLRQHPGSSRS